MATIRDLLVSIGFKVDENQFLRAEAKVKQVKTGMEQLGKSSTDATGAAGRGFKGVGDEADKASKKTSDALKRTRDAAKSANAEMRTTSDILNTWGNRLNALAAFAGVSLSAGAIIGKVDEWKVIAGQVKLVTKNQQEAAETEKELYKMAGRTRQSYAETANLFTTVARNASDMGKSTEDVLAFTEDVSRAMLIGGGSAESQKAALIQLGQALGSGVLRGEELNSVMAQAPRLSKAIADGMGTTISQLRNMAMEGKLTSTEVFNAIRSQTERLQMEMGQIPWTVQQASNRMTDAMGKFFYEIEKRTGVVGNLAAGIAKVGEYIENIDIDRFVAGFRLLAIYAAAFFVASKWGAIIRGAEMFIGTLKAIRNSYLAATGAQVVFQSASAKSAVLGLLSMGKFLLIGAVITAVILILQDLYTWINGGESVIGSFFGSWQSNIDALKTKWAEVTKTFDEFMQMRVIDMLKTAVEWAGKLIDKIKDLAGEKLESSKEWLKENIYDPDKGWFNGVVESARKQGPAVPRGLQDSLAVKGLRQTSNTNNVNQNNYINVTAPPGASTGEIAQRIVDKIPQPTGGGYDPGYDVPETEMV